MCRVAVEILRGRRGELIDRRNNPGAGARAVKPMLKLQPKLYQLI